MGDTEDDSPNYSYEVNKVILTGARETLLEKIKADLISIHEKLQSFLPESCFGPKEEALLAVADTLKTLSLTVSKDLARKLHLDKKISEFKTEEIAQLISAQLEKAQDISEVGSEKQVEEKLVEISESPDKEKEHVISETLGILEENVNEKISKPPDKEKQHVISETLSILEENVNEKISEPPDKEKELVISETLGILEENVNEKISEPPFKDTKKKTSIEGKRRSSSKKSGVSGKYTDKLAGNISSFVGSELEKVQTIVETLADLKDTEEVCTKSITVQLQAVAETLAAVRKQVQDGIAESLVDAEVERAEAIAEILALLGEEIELILIEHISCPVETINQIAEILSYLKTQCDNGIGYRAFALHINIHKTILKILRIFSNEVDITYPAFETLISMSRDLPEILNEEAIQMIMFFFDNIPIAATRQQILRWIHVCMAHSEENRDKLYIKGIISYFKLFLDDDTTTSPVISDLCHAIGSFVECNKYSQTTESYVKAQQRIDESANTFLARMTYLLRKFLNNESLLKDLLITLRKLLAQNYLCELILYVKKGKALLYLYDVFIHHRLSQGLVCELLELFHVMVINDITKSTMMEAGVAYIIKHALDSHPDSQEVTEVTFKCIARITLRCPFNTALFVDFGFPSRIIKGMQNHVSNYTIQKIGSWIIRIFVTYVIDLVPFLIHLGIPEVLHDAIDQHVYKCEFDAKAALRDLYENTDLYEPIRNPISDITEIQFPL